MSTLQLKICGIKHNIEEVTILQPDYLGFIFYDKSPRFFEGKIPNLPERISKVGVFVNASAEYILEKTETHQLDIIQLHGEETTLFCKELRKTQIKKEVWKVFSIKDSFDFSQLADYENIVDKFKFDTKGKEKVGNGYTFDWSLLKGYNLTKPFILSGGIGLDELPDLKKIITSGLPIHAIDVNSKFEISPGLKNTTDLKILKDEL